MGVKEGISAWMKKRKARKIALNIESKYSIEISLLKELAEDLEALLHLVSVKSKDLEKESRNYLLHIFRVYRKLARLEKRVFREERKIEEHFLSDLQGKLSDKYDSKSHLKDILDRLHAENNSLLKALSGFHGRLGIDLKNIGTEADFLSSARGHGNLHDDQELWRLKGDLESEIGLIKELIGFAHAAIIDFDSLEKEAVLLSRRKFMLGAGATAAVAATMKLGDIFEEAKVNFQFSSATEGRAVFLIKSKKDGVEFVAIKLRQGWSYSRIAELYCKKGKGAVSVLKEYNDNIGEISVGDYLFFPKGELALDVLSYKKLILTKAALKGVINRIKG